MNGTWVSVGPLRARFLGAFRAVGPRRVIVGARPRFPRRAGHSGPRGLPQARARSCRADAPAAAVLADARVRDKFASLLIGLAATSRGTSAAHPPRHSAGRAAVARRRRGHRQGFDQSARRTCASRRFGRRALRRSPAGARDRRGRLLIFPRKREGSGEASEIERSELMMDIKGQTAIVTGGASGLGAATARMLAAAGAKVALFDVDAKNAADGRGGNQRPRRPLRCRRRRVDRSGVRQGRRRPRPRAHPHQLRRHRPGAADRRARQAAAARRFRQEVISVNLIGTFNAMRLAAGDMQTLLLRSTTASAG